MMCDGAASPYSLRGGATSTPCRPACSMDRAIRPSRLASSRTASTNAIVAVLPWPPPRTAAPHRSYRAAGDSLDGGRRVRRGAGGWRRSEPRDGGVDAAGAIEEGSRGEPHHSRIIPPRHRRLVRLYSVSTCPQTPRGRLHFAGIWPIYRWKSSHNAPDRGGSLVRPTLSRAAKRFAGPHSWSLA
jgi:hypothetical protein